MTWRRKETGALTHSWLRVSTSTFLEENLAAFIKTRLTKTSSHADPTWKFYSEKFYRRTQEWKQILTYEDSHWNVVCHSKNKKQHLVLGSGPNKTLGCDHDWKSTQSAKVLERCFGSQEGGRVLELRKCWAPRWLLCTRALTESAHLACCCSYHPHLTDKESPFGNLSKVTLLVRGIPTQAKPPESVHLSIQHMALITDNGRREAELRAQNTPLS